MVKTPRIADARRMVIKIGSSLVASSTQGTANLGWMRSLAADIAPLHATGVEVILVSSGAVALGRSLTGLGTGKLSLEEKQAAAAAGQPLLIQAWAKAFAKHDINVAQLLLTLDDSEQRQRYLNARSTFSTLLTHRLIPIVNENDTVATAELKFGDNDRLAARVAAMVGADTLILFSDIDGLYTADPRKHKSASHIPVVETITPNIMAMGGDAATATSNGGMRTKLEAASMAMAAGCHMAIAKGIENHAFKRLAEGGAATWFIASTKPQLARKHWIATSVLARGAVVIDDGAAAALAKGKSLLPAGVKRIEGSFERGDTIAIKTLHGDILARGITGYDSAEAALIIGQKTSAVEKILGYAGRDTLIHRDDLAMMTVL